VERRIAQALHVGLAAAIEAGGFALLLAVSGVAEILCLRCDRLAGDGPAITEAGAIVKAAVAVEGAQVFAIRVNDAYIGELANVAVNAGQIIERAGVGLGIAGRNGLAGPAVIDAKQAQCPGTGLAGEASAKLRARDVVGVIEIDRRLKIAAVLNEERAHFRKVRRKTLVGRSRIVHADLAEVRVERGVEHQAVVQNEFCVEPRIALQVLVFKVRIDRIDAVELAQIAGERVRLQLHVLAVANVLKAFDDALLRELAGNVVAVAGPKVGLAVAGDVALQNDAPAAKLIGTGLGEVKTHKRNAHEHDEAVGRAAPPGVPHGIEGVVVAVLLAVERIGLNSECVALKDKGAAMVAEGIEKERDLVIVAERVAGDHVRAHVFGVGIFADKGRVEGVVRVAEIGRGAVLWPAAIVRVALNEVRHAEHLRGH
jgi:hypothetical protein